MIAVVGSAAIIRMRGKSAQPSANHFRAKGPDVALPSRVDGQIDDVTINCERCMGFWKE